MKRWMMRVCFWLFAMLGAVPVAYSAGGTVHVMMSEKAVEHVKTPELKAVLEKFSDQIFDHLFIRKVGEMDGEGQSVVDTACDMDAFIVLGTFPENQEEILSIDSGTIDSGISVFFTFFTYCPVNRKMLRKPEWKAQPSATCAFLCRHRQV